MSKIQNVNVGLLGHVDSGKTSLAKSLSQVSSTACFDKNPQSQERGITIDLGFSSFAVDNVEKVGCCQFTLVDCPGHASLIKTIIGGAQIIDVVILVIDVTKGVQTQTAECLVISEIINKEMIVALNKVDLIPIEKRQHGIDKVTKKLQITLKNTPFKNAPIIPTSSILEDSLKGTEKLKCALCQMVQNIERPVGKPMVLSVDHCFTIKGKGTILTGTVIQGKIEINDNVEIPALKQVKKVKSMQMFKKEVKEVIAGDRVGVCVTQFDPKLLERGLVCAPNYINPIFGAIIRLNKVSYYQNSIATGAKYHVTIGHETVIAKVVLFQESEGDFDFDKDYMLVDEYEIVCFALLQFEHAVLSPKNCLMIGSKLDMDVNTPSCRLVFYGTSIFDIADKNYETSLLPKLKIFKYKQKTGVVHKMNNANEIIANSLFKKETKMHAFTNLKIQLSTGEMGYIESTFGQGGKVKIKIPNGLQPETEQKMAKKDKNDKHQNSEKVNVILKFKRYIYDKDKKIIQD